MAGGSGVPSNIAAAPAALTQPNFHGSGSYANMFAGAHTSEAPQAGGSKGGGIPMTHGFAPIGMDQSNAAIAALHPAPVEQPSIGQNSGWSEH